MDNEVQEIVNELVINAERLVEKKNERVTLKAKTAGLGALLANLRSEKPSTSYENHEKSDEPEAKKTCPDRPLNRKERRALQQAELKEKYEKEKENANNSTDPTVFEPAKVPTSIELKFCDEAAFLNYKASFGPESVQNNNYVRFSLIKGDFAAVASQDRYVRVYKNLQDPKPTISWKHNMGGLIYDLSWLKNGDQFATTSKDHPIHLWDAQTGDRLAAFIGRDYADAVEGAFCVGTSGNHIVGGYKKYFKLWDIERAGQHLLAFPFFDKTYGAGLTNQSMSIDSHPKMEKIFATVGCCDRVAVYSEQYKSAITTIIGSPKGYTHVRYSEDGNRLFASERKGDIHVFDLRMNSLTQIMKREMVQNHRTVFDIDFAQRILYSGTSSGEVVAFDINSYLEEVEPIFKKKIASTCVPCVSQSNSRLVACSGERLFPRLDIIDTDEENEDQLTNCTLYPTNSFQVFDVSF